LPQVQNHRSSLRGDQPRAGSGCADTLALLLRRVRDPRQRRTRCSPFPQKTRRSTEESAQPCPQLGSRHPLQFALPDRPDPPSEPPQLAVVRDVAFPVASELGEPEARVRLRQPAPHAAVEVPEASPDLQDDEVLRRDDEPHRVERTANPEFGARVFRPYAGHVCRPLLGRDPVRHAESHSLPRAGVKRIDGSIGQRLGSLQAVRLRRQSVQGWTAMNSCWGYLMETDTTSLLPSRAWLLLRLLDSQVGDRRDRRPIWFACLTSPSNADQFLPRLRGRDPTNSAPVPHKRAILEALRWQTFPYPKREPSPQGRVQVADLDPVPTTFAAASAP
jgi:hypothetical protein